MTKKGGGKPVCAITAMAHTLARPRCLEHRCVARRIGARASRGRGAHAAPQGLSCTRAFSKPPLTRRAKGYLTADQEGALNELRSRVMREKLFPSKEALMPDKRERPLQQRAGDSLVKTRLAPLPARGASLVAAR